MCHLLPPSVLSSALPAGHAHTPRSRIVGFSRSHSNTSFFSGCRCFQMACTKEHGCAIFYRHPFFLPTSALLASHVHTPRSQRRVFAFTHHALLASGFSVHTQTLLFFAVVAVFGWSARRNMDMPSFTAFLSSRLPVIFTHIARGFRSHHLGNEKRVFFSASSPLWRLNSVSNNPCFRMTSGTYLSRNRILISFVVVPYFLDSTRTYLAPRSAFKNVICNFSFRPNGSRLSHDRHFFPL